MVNGHNMSPEEQKAYYGSKDANSRNWNSLSPDAQEDARELWDVLSHYYVLAEFYDDLERHDWSHDTSDGIEKIIEYNGPEFEKLYYDYRVWAQSGEGDVMKPERPADEVYDDDEEEDNGKA